MKLALGAIKNAEPSLKKLLNADLHISVAFILSKLIKTIESELTHYEEQRQTLVKKHGEDDGNGNIHVKESAYNEFFSDLAELNKIEVEVAFQPISVAKLDGVKLSAVDLAMLADFITE
jgi:hypothetical protein